MIDSMATDVDFLAASEHGIADTQCDFFFFPSVGLLFM
jgi:hypothetical protein